MSYYLGVLNPDHLTVKLRDTLLAEDGWVKYPIPPVADIIASRFTVRGKNLDHSYISRNEKDKNKPGLDKAIVLDLEILFSQIHRIGLVRHYIKQDTKLDWDGALSILFSLFNNPKVDQNTLKEDLEAIDFEALRVLNDLLAEHGADRKAIAEDLPKID